MDIEAPVSREPIAEPTIIIPEE
jgi:hypothetical protein